MKFHESIIDNKIVRHIVILLMMNMLPKKLLRLPKLYLKLWITIYV